MYFNKVILLGRLVKNPEVRFANSGLAIGKLVLVVSRKYKSLKNNIFNEEVLFVDVSIFGKTAQTIVKFFKKGSCILVEGRLKFDSWEDLKGTKRTKLYVIMESFSFVSNTNTSKEISLSENEIETSSINKTNTISNDEEPF